jgi:hypothetical protein
MSGSLVYRQYTDDAGVVYTIRIDESNSEATVTGASGNLCLVRGTSSPKLPKSDIKPRYVNCYNAALPTQKRKFIIGDATKIGAVLAVGAVILGEGYPGTNDTAGGTVTWVITSYRGEQRNIVPGVAGGDTGLTDGDIGN